MLEEKIFNDYKQALRDKDTLKSSVLNFLRASLINTAIAKKKDKLDDEEIMAVIRKQIKEHQDSIEQFTKGNRLDLADKETKELEILKGFLPEELPIEEIKKIIEEAVALTGASSLKDMGKVMREVTPKIAGRADAKVVSDLVRNFLTSGV